MLSRVFLSDDSVNSYFDEKCSFFELFSLYWYDL